MSELGKVMIFRRIPRALPDGCIHCGKSRTFCQGLQERRSGECCCHRCEVADRDPH